MRPAHASWRWGGRLYAENSTLFSETEPRGRPFRPTWTLRGELFLQSIYSSSVPFAGLRVEEREGPRPADNNAGNRGDWRGEAGAGFPVSTGDLQGPAAVACSFKNERKTRWGAASYREIAVAPTTRVAASSADNTGHLQRGPNGPERPRCPTWAPGRTSQTKHRRGFQPARNRLEGLATSDPDVIMSETDALWSV